MTDEHMPCISGGRRLAAVNALRRPPIARQQLAAGEPEGVVVPVVGIPRFTVAEHDARRQRPRRGGPVGIWRRNRAMREPVGGERGHGDEQGRRQGCRDGAAEIAGCQHRDHRGQPGERRQFEGRGQCRSEAGRGEAGMRAEPIDRDPMREPGTRRSAGRRGHVVGEHDREGVEKRAARREARRPEPAPVGGADAIDQAE